MGCCKVSSEDGYPRTLLKEDRENKGFREVEGGLENSADITGRVANQLGKVAVHGRYHGVDKRIEDQYDIHSDKVLGTGYNGSVFLASSKSSEGRFAVKAFPLEVFDKHMTNVQRELEIFLSLDHPHVVRLFDVYETDCRLYLVMECMEGGEVLDRLIQCDGHGFNEGIAANLVWQMLVAISYLHNLGIIHQDLKLENFLFESKASEHIKLIDFGFSSWIRKDESLKADGGTLRYAAPERLFGLEYTAKADLWSLGVMTFVLLTGMYPFDGMPETIDRLIKTADLKSTEVPIEWPSKDAERFVKALLVVEPDERLSAEQAMKHSWLQSRRDPSPHAMNNEIVNRLRRFGQASRFRRACLVAMAWSLSNEERAKLRAVFLAIDTDRTGYISLDELRRAMTCFGVRGEEIKQVFEAIDGSHSQKIEYSEFLAAAMSSQVALSEDLVNAAFNRFDRNGDGYITIENLKSIADSPNAVQDYISEVKPKDSGRITRKEFGDFLRSSKTARAFTSMRSPSMKSLLADCDELTDYDEPRDESLARTDARKERSSCTACIANDGCCIPFFQITRR